MRSPLPLPLAAPPAFILVLVATAETLQADAFRIPATPASSATRRSVPTINDPEEYAVVPPSPSSLRIGSTSAASIVARRAVARRGDGEAPRPSPEIDLDALAKYAVAAVVELSLFAALFRGIDVASSQLGADVPFPAVAFVFYAASIKSRALNPLDNRRPDLKRAASGEGGSSGFRDRVMPSWTPPGVLFPIMWLLIIGPIRAYSSALVVTSTGSFLTVPTMAFILHLTIGDVWNTINNTEKRYGAAVVGVTFVVFSAAAAAYQYSTVDPLSGKLLAGTLLWLVTAGALIADTWRLNPMENGENVPLFPVKGEAETSFLWFNKEDQDQ